METKINERVLLDGIFYECKPVINLCDGCDLITKPDLCRSVLCKKWNRTDKKDVVYKRVLK